MWLGLSLRAQQPREELTGITARPVQQAENQKVKKKVMAVDIPVSDDFSYAQEQSNPRSGLWLDQDVYVNITYGIDPITLGVATFDGLDKFGLPYDQGNTATDTTDMLTSQPVNLGNTNGNVVLSFYYQSEGLGESPSFSDSLTLNFYSPTTQEWKSVWRARGEDTEPFELVQIPITLTRYLQDGFQFRFIAYGSGGGAFDMWHIDRVVLDDERDTSDTDFFDLSFTSQPPSLLKEFEAIPWFHYNSVVANQLNRTEWEVAYRRNVVPGASFGLGLKLYKILYNGTVLAERTPANADFNEDNTHIANAVNPFLVQVDNFPLPSAPTGEFEITAINNYSGVPVGRNDSLIRTQVFKNYYAYDDGSAERIYRVRDNAGGCIIAKYDLRVADSLKGLFLYFLPGLQNSPDNTFSIVIFENNSGVPGNLIYESDTLFTPQYSFSNNFLPYALPTDTSGVYLEGKPYFIGIRQTNIIELTIGFDKNNTGRSEIFYGPDNDLFPSFVEGSLMMRPFFKYVPDDIGLQEQPHLSLNFQVYPNPSSDGVLSVETPQASENEIFTYRIFSISGQLIMEGKLSGNQIQANHLDSGIYLIELESSEASIQAGFQKVVISR